MKIATVGIGKTGVRILEKIPRMKNVKRIAILRTHKNRISGNLENKGEI